MIRLALLLWCFAFPALASQDAWPALYDVSGVAADDVLNIRNLPDARSQVINTLPFDAKDVEVIRLNPSSTWALVNSGERSGWVSLSFLKRQSEQFQGARMNVRTCFGTEPFWTLKIPQDDTSPAVFSKLGEPEQIGGVSERLTSANRRDESGLVFWFKQAGSSVALITQTSCSDGMSDASYGLRVSFLHTTPTGPTLLSGCCSLKR